MDRRAFLSIVAGSPFVFGLRELLAQDPTPDHVTAALKRMKETRRYGVVLVIPPGKKGQVRLGEAILARLSRPVLEDNEIFLEVVFLCVTQAQAETLGKRPFEEDAALPDGVHRLLLDPDGNRVASDRIELTAMESWAPFNESFDKFVHGVKGERREKQRKEIEKTLAPEILKAGERLLRPRPQGYYEQQEDLKERGAAAETLKKNADVVAPWLALQSNGLPGQGPFRMLLWDHYLDQPELDPEPSLPYGIRVERFMRKGGCGEAVLCGMARIRLTDYRFLEFLTQ